MVHCAASAPVEQTRLGKDWIGLDRIGLDRIGLDGLLPPFGVCTFSASSSSPSSPSSSSSPACLRRRVADWRTTISPFGCHCVITHNNGCTLHRCRRSREQLTATKTTTRRKNCHYFFAGVCSFHKRRVTSRKTEGGLLLLLLLLLLSTKIDPNR